MLLRVGSFLAGFEFFFFVLTRFKLTRRAASSLWHCLFKKRVPVVLCRIIFVLQPFYARFYVLHQVRQGTVQCQRFTLSV